MSYRGGKGVSYSANSRPRNAVGQNLLVTSTISRDRTAGEAVGEQGLLSRLNSHPENPGLKVRPRAGLKRREQDQVY